MIYKSEYNNQSNVFDSTLNLLRTPEPPYYTVITNKIRPAKLDANYYSEMQFLERHVQNFSGYLGMECVEEILEDGTIHGISVIYWQTLESLDAWRNDPAHINAKELGKRNWYLEHNVRICCVLSQYGSNLTQGRTDELAYKGID